MRERLWSRQLRVRKADCHFRSLALWHGVVERFLRKAPYGCRSRSVEWDDPGLYRLQLRQRAKRSFAKRRLDFGPSLGAGYT